MNWRQSAARGCASTFGFLGVAALALTAACSPETAAVSSTGGATGGSAEQGGAASGAAGDTAGTLGGFAVAGGGSSSGGSQAGAASGSSGAGGGAVVDCHDVSDSGPLTTRLPCLLSATGLYGPDMATLAQGVHPYGVTFGLWADDADKKRWVALPQGSKIETAEMDYWTFPAGTKLWKEFARDGVRIETRLLEKQASGSWYAVAYQWRSDQKEADAVPNGVVNASGTAHDIPDGDQCLTCHSQTPDKALGFSAIQLSHDKLEPSSELEWTLTTLIDDGLLTSPPEAPFTIPGTELERKFFGYLHANCGHCHNPKGSANSQTGLDLWLKVADLKGTVRESSVYKDIFDTAIAWLDGEHPDAPKRVAPGSLADSAIYQRFIKKGETWSMPPLGTELVDPEGKKLFEDWIGSTN
jgi:hypothetical protein